MDLTIVPDEIWIKWIALHCDLSKSGVESFLTLAKMSDSEKSTALEAYLAERMTDNTSQISSLAATTAAVSAALNADNALCQGLLGN